MSNSRVSSSWTSIWDIAPGDRPRRVGLNKNGQVLVSVGDYMPNSWVMFNWEIYQPLMDGDSTSDLEVFLQP